MEIFYAKVYGYYYKVTAFFNDVKMANQYLEDNPDEGVIKVTGYKDQVLVRIAKNSDQGVYDEPCY